MSQVTVKLDSPDKVTIYRTRPATDEERVSDPEAVDMVEVVSIEFGSSEPKISVNRDLSAAE